MNSDDFYAFLRDPKLIELIEQNKTTDDLLDVIKLGEIQHSEVLAWCMNPNEGHSQGDAVIKDFLEAAYFEGVDPIYDNKKFFAKWTPGRIRTTSFGAAFVTREFAVKVEDGKKKGRLDLFLVDTQNKIFVTIENKAGAKLSAVQLEKYVAAVKQEVSSRPVFADYDQAFIVLDRDLKYYPDAHLNALSKRWTLLDYSWLRWSAERAGFQLARGKSAAQLLVAYCQKQSDWESPAEKRASELATDLALAHPSVVEEIRTIRTQSILKWTLKTLDGESGELTLFHSQYSEICKQLIGIQSIATIIDQLLRLPTSVSRGHIERGRTWFDAIPSAALKWMQPGDDARWPMYVSLYRDAKASRPDAPRFTLRLIWARGQFNSSVDEDALRRHFATAFPSLTKFAASDRRAVVIARLLSLSEAVQRTKQLLEETNSRINSYSDLLPS